MFRYTWLLLKLRFRLTWNGVRRWSLGRKLLMAAIVLVMASVMVGIYGASVVGGMGLAAFVGLGFFGRFLPLFFLAAYFLLFTSSFATALGELYLTSDLELLLAAPVPMRAVFTAKFVQTLVSSYGIWFFLGLPAFLGLGTGAGYHWLYFVCLVPVFVAVPFIPNGVGALAVIVLARYIPARRLREMIAVVGGLVGICCYLVSQMVGPAVEHSESWADPTQALSTAQQALSIDLFFLPTTWAGNGLVAAGTGQWLWAVLYLGLFAGASVAVYVACLLVAERLYYIGWAGLGTVASRRKSDAQGASVPVQVQRPRRAARRMPLLPANVWAVARKDFTYLRRDVRVLLQTAVWPIAVIAVIMFQIVMASGEEELPRSVAAFASIGSGGLVLFLVSAMFSRLSLVAISQEGRNYWVLRTAPLSTMRLLWGKLIVAYVPLLVLGTVVMVMFSVLVGDGPLDIAWNLLMIAMAGLGISAIGLSFGAAFPRFNWDNPQRAVNGWAALLAMACYGVYVVIVFAAFSIPRFMGLLATGLVMEGGISFTWPDLAGWVGVGYVVALALALGLTALSVVVPLNLAARRLDRVEV
ncbi:MAG: hypothetical protein KKA73_12170 [Chloroflexi bacterium]|nr:hypothetical protein [Chloroflexota bacterium]MBU1748437.1 hypothetical protein [Chloroflexota bacterium]MBU1877726.1 hypothetical protein [Chloroflexota bacterium]